MASFCLVIKVLHRGGRYAVMVYDHGSLRRDEVGGDNNGGEWAVDVDVQQMWTGGFEAIERCDRGNSVSVYISCLVIEYWTVSLG